MPAEKIHGVSVYNIFDPHIPDYWEGQKVTLPPIEGNAEDWEMSEENFQHIKSQVGKTVLLHSVEVDVSGKAEEAYYNIFTEGGVMFNMNFAIFPVEMAMKFGYAGEGHFGEHIPLSKHPHYSYKRLMP